MVQRGNRLSVEMVNISNRSLIRWNPVRNADVSRPSLPACSQREPSVQTSTLLHFIDGAHYLSVTFPFLPFPFVKEV